MKHSLNISDLEVEVDYKIIKGSKGDGWLVPDEKDRIEVTNVWYSGKDITSHLLSIDYDLDLLAQEIEEKLN